MSESDFPPLRSEWTIVKKLLGLYRLSVIPETNRQGTQVSRDIRFVRVLGVKSTLGRGFREREKKRILFI